MTSDNKKAKADPAPKSEAPAKDKSTPGEAISKTGGGAPEAAVSKTESKTESKAESKAESKTEGPAPAAAPSNYSRGEGQKPVSAAYKENWNAIFAKKSATKKSATKKNLKKRTAKKKSAKKTKRYSRGEAS